MEKKTSGGPAKAKKQSQGDTVGPVRYDVSLLSADDLFIFNEGNHFRLYEKLGGHCLESNGVTGVYFAVWAPDAERVCVIGDFNGWHKESHPLGYRGHPASGKVLFPASAEGQNINTTFIPATTVIA